MQKEPIWKDLRSKLVAAYKAKKFQKDSARGSSGGSGYGIRPQSPFTGKTGQGPTCWAKAEKKKVTSAAVKFVENSRAEGTRNPGDGPAYRIAAFRRLVDDVRSEKVSPLVDLRPYLMKGLGYMLSVLVQ